MQPTPYTFCRSIVSKKNKQLQRQQQGMKSTFCSTCLHPPAGCPAKRDKCHKCSRAGHSARVCRSSSIAALGDVDSEDSISSVSCCLSDRTTTKQTVQEDVIFNRVKAVTGLIDLGATDYFITLKLGQREPSFTRLANEFQCIVHGHREVSLAIKDEIYSIRLSVVDSLIADDIIGMDILSSRKVVPFALVGLLLPLTFISPSNSACFSIFPMMQVDPPIFFADNISSAKSISTKARGMSNPNKLVIKNEIQRLKKLGIIEESMSSWRAQTFVVKGENRKRRMVVDYSETVNL